MFKDVLAGINEVPIVAQGIPVVQNPVVPPQVVPPARMPVVPVGAARALFRGPDRRNLANANNEGMTINFLPATLATVLRNQEGQRIVELCIWCPSGLEPEQISYFVTDDMKNLRYQVPMDFLMENGWGLHRDVVEGGQRLSRQERGNHVRVHHWNAFIDEMRSSDGLLPMFSSDIPLPVEVCSKKILRQSPKESGWGSRMLVLDLLVEDSKLPAVSKKRGFEIVNEDDDEWGYDTDDLTLSTVQSKRTKKGNK
jgi:hypothetical protein